MKERFTFDLMDDPGKLSKLGFFSDDVYRVLLACQKGELTEEDFESRYYKDAAILILDMTGLTTAVMDRGVLHSLLRILDAQKVCGPVFEKFNAYHVRAFADDLTAIFEDVHDALNAAIEIHHRIRLFNNSDLAGPNPVDCCIGIGYGGVYSLGTDRAMGDEMNRASRLGEDIADPEETLITEQVYQLLKDEPGYTFEKCTRNDVPLTYYRASAC